MHPQLQLLVALQDTEGMIAEVESAGAELEGMGFKHGGLDDLKKAHEEIAGKIDPRLAGLYRRLKERFGHAVVPVVTNLCTGCFASIPSSARSCMRPRSSCSHGSASPSGSRESTCAPRDRDWRRPRKSAVTESGRRT